MSENNGRAANNANYIVSTIWRLLLRFALIAALLYGCYRLRNIITTIFIAAIIAYVLDPAVDWLCRRRAFVHFHTALANVGLSIKIAYRRIFYHEVATQEGRARLHRHALRVYASLYVFVLALILLWQGTSLIAKPFVTEFHNAVENQASIRAEINDRLELYDKTAPEALKSDKIREGIKKLDIGKAAQQIGAEVGAKVLESAKNIVEVVVLPVLAFYFLIDGRKLKHEFVSLVPGRYLRETMRMICEFNRIMRAFVVGQVILCLLAGVVIGFVLWILGVKYPFVMGVLAGVTRAIPIIGPIIGGIPIILLTLATKGPGTALAVLAFFTFLHFAESKFIMPLLIGDRMELHPVVIIIVLVAGGEIGGLLIGGSIGSLLGMFFAAPLASIARVMIRRYWLRLTAHNSPHSAVSTQNEFSALPSTSQPN